MNTKIFTECDNIKEKILSCKKLDRLLSGIKEAAEEFEKTSIEALDFSTFSIYSKSGSRREFEKKYFARRARLNAFTMLFFLYGEKKYKSALEDIIWAICDEYTWALPAHFSIDISPDEAAEHIDLFSAETGFALCEVLRLTEDMLSPVVVKRAEYEVKRRIINSFLKGTFRWEKQKHNWAAVCAGSVGGCLMYMADEETVKTLVPRLNNSIENYLSSLGGDGTCYEGYEYFKYGFGYFTYYAALLNEYTDGKINLFKKYPKIEKAAKYAQSVNLGYGNMVNFADSLSGAWHLPGLSSFLSANFDGVSMPEEEGFLSFGQDGEHRFAHFVRDFVWTALYEGKTNENKETDRFTYFEESGLYVKITPSYEFASVAGKNNVPHNHNDIGTFILRCKGDAIIEDLGKGLYCADYFNDKRYTFLATSSRGHSVPIIASVDDNEILRRAAPQNDMMGCHSDSSPCHSDSSPCHSVSSLCHSERSEESQDFSLRKSCHFQKFGGEYFGTVKRADANSFTIEMHTAYDCPELKSLVRSFDFLKNSFTLTDKFVFSSLKHFPVERFISLTKPELTGDDIYINSKKLLYNKEKWKLNLSCEDFETSHGKKLAYLIDFVLKTPEQNPEFKLKIDL